MKKQKSIIAASLVIFVMTITPHKVYPATNTREMVVLLHGLGRHAASMRKMANHLKKSGYDVININYASRHKSIKEIAEQDVANAVELCKEKNADKIHFVTHSLGGIVLRQYLQDETLPKGSRAVLLSPPNKGSELAEFMRNFFLYKWLTGPAGQALGTGEESIPDKLLPVDMEIGIIAGNKSINPGFSKLIQGPNDGKVSVARSKLEEMSDFLVVPATHTFIMRHPVVLSQAQYFLENGKFQKENETVRAK